MTKVENKVLDFVDRKKAVFAIAFFAVAGLVIRFLFKDYESDDFVGFLQVWFEELKEGGGLKGMAVYGGNYNFAYVTIMALLTYLPIQPLYTIKFVSVVFDVLLAVSAGLLVKRAYKGDINTFAVAFGIVFLCPTVMLNSALWAQCDSIYTTFVILSLLYLLEDRYNGAFIMLGVALGFKLQAILILPVFMLVYFINRKFSVLRFLLVPAATVAVSIPGMIFAGGGIKLLILTYVGQMRYKGLLSNNFPNIYYWFDSAYYDLFNVAGVIFAMCVLFTVYYVIYSKKKALSGTEIITVALWTVLCCVYLLPNMHERYGYAGEILCIVWAFGNRRWAWYPAVLNIIAVLCYFAVLFFHVVFPLQNLSIVTVVLFIVFTVKMLREMNSEGVGETT